VPGASVIPRQNVHELSFFFHFVAIDSPCDVVRKIQWHYYLFLGFVHPVPSGDVECQLHGIANHLLTSLLK